MHSAASCHAPVVYRAHSADELRDLGAKTILKVAELGRRSDTVICLPVLPVVYEPGRSDAHFWTEVNSLPMCQAEIRALPLCTNGDVPQNAVEFTLFGNPRVGSEWRKSEQTDRHDHHQSSSDGMSVAELSSIIGTPFDHQQISPELRSQHPMILWLVFHSVGPSAVEMISLPHCRDIFDYEAFGAVPRVFCGLCCRDIPVQIMQTPCAFHPGKASARQTMRHFINLSATGLSQDDMQQCCHGPTENPGCMLEKTHLLPDEVSWTGRERWNCATKA